MNIKVNIFNKSIIEFIHIFDRYKNRSKNQFQDRSTLLQFNCDNLNNNFIATI